MKTEFIPVVHDAVKIGLGALIGGVFALLGTWLASKRKLHERVVERRQDSLEEIATDLEHIHAIVIDKSSVLSAAEITEQDSNPDAVRHIMESEQDRTSDSFEQALYDLHTIEARLCLLGHESTSAMVEKYRTHISLILDLEDTLEREEGPVLEDVRAFQQQAMTMRLDIVRALANAYKRI